MIKSSEELRLRKKKQISGSGTIKFIVYVMSYKGIQHQVEYLAYCRLD